MTGITRAVTDVAEVDLQLVETITIAGSAETNIDFTGLDINSDGYYIAILNIKSAIANYLRLYVNDDYTTANYDSQSHIVAGTSAEMNRYDEGTMARLEIGANLILCKISRSPDGYFKSISQSSSGPSPKLSTYATTKAATVANITSLRFNMGAANGFAIGSTISLYKISKT